MEWIADFAPDSVEAGTGLVIQDAAERYLFFLAGTRHRCPPGTLFYAGIGGHREEGESWIDCAQREAQEEVGTTVEILSANSTWYLPQDGPAQILSIRDRPQPLAFYEMIHSADAPRAGAMYRIVIYQARLQGRPKNLPTDEVQGVVALTREQVIAGIEHQPSLQDLLSDGAEIVTGAEQIDLQTRLYPLGTAVALSHILRQD